MISITKKWIREGIAGTISKYTETLWNSMLLNGKSYHHNSEINICKIERVLIMKSQATLLKIARVEENAFKGTYWVNN